MKTEYVFVAYHGPNKVTPAGVAPIKSILIYSILFMLSTTVCGQKSSAVVESNNRFAFKLYQELNTSVDNNLFYSPFSISTALAMTYAGARNETALQIVRTMNFPLGTTFNQDYSNLLNKISDSAGNKIVLRIANGLWAQRDFRFLDSYFDMIKSKYKSEIKNVDFKDADNREKTRLEINAWVEQKTKNKITDILGKGVLDTFTRLVLVNAIYFYGDWLNKFEKRATVKEPFYGTGNSPVKATFMRQKMGFNYFEDTMLKAIEIPYKDNKASMIIFLPNERDGVGNLEKSFDYKYYSGIVESFQKEQVALSLPKFKTTVLSYLAPALAKMGMPDAFSTTQADFSGMTGLKNLYISTVIHKAFIDVTEEGTEAAAATTVIMEMTSAPASRENFKVFRADHPFIFVIRDNSTGSILFMGKIMNPTLQQ